MSRNEAERYSKFRDLTNNASIMIGIKYQEYSLSKRNIKIYLKRYEDRMKIYFHILLTKRRCVALNFNLTYRLTPSRNSNRLSIVFVEFNIPTTESYETLLTLSP